MAEGMNGIYEGPEPYLFISYSHLDSYSMSEVLSCLKRMQVRFWYDNGLNSGANWNAVIAAHLKNAAVCLLLLSPNSAESDYVKNELQFALNHRIPVHTLLLCTFEIPSEIELMITRIQMLPMTDGYEEHLARALPPEPFTAPGEGKQREGFTHPIFEAAEALDTRQGTAHLKGRHRTLKYPVRIQEDALKLADKPLAQSLAVKAAAVIHPLFPRILDVSFENGRMYTFLEDRGEVFLDEYLKEHKPDEARILSWIRLVTEGLACLYKRGLAVRDLSRGSMTVTQDGSIGVFRLQNIYYGIFELQMDNRQYYFERELQEIGVLICQLCTGETPVLPFPMIRESRLSRRFLEKINLIVQNCARESGQPRYSGFEALLRDMERPGISLKDRVFLRRREKKLDLYEKAKQANTRQFTKYVPQGPMRPADGGSDLESQYGLDSTVRFSPVQTAQTEARIRIRFCSTGQVVSCPGNQVTIGRDENCEVMLDQPSVSRRHTKITQVSGETFIVEDCGSTNGTYILTYSGDTAKTEPVTSPRQVDSGTMLRLGSIDIQIL